jgi:4'-phosphopantetheinyl transferase
MGRARAKMIADTLAALSSRPWRHERPPAVVHRSGHRRAPRLEDREIHIWCVDLDRGSDTERADESILSSDEQARANRFRIGTLRKRFVAGRAMRRKILAGYLGAGPAELQFVEGPSGKPRLGPHLAKGIEFNVSHSDAALLVAVARDVEIGIDLERMSASAPVVLAARYFSTHEQRALAALPRQELAAGFFSVWTQKESLVKAVGSGLSMPLHCFDVMPNPGGVGRLTTRSKSIEAGRWRIYALDCFPGFACAVAVSGTARRLTVFDRGNIAPGPSCGLS